MSDTVPIAIVGMACRLPGGVTSPEDLWELLSNGRSGWCEVPEDRWNAASFYNPDPEAKEALNSKSGYFLKEDITQFDARFFNSPSWEAHTMDPQQRILLETTYEALENAGIPLESIRGSDTSVYIGMYGRDFDRMGFKDLSQVTKGQTTGAGDAIMSNRISYVFDLKGASMTIDTGCSGSMVALHQACLSLRAKESRMAIVGGAQLLLNPDQSVAMSMVGMVNPEGRCFVFDDRGSGYARGEGVGTVILKRLDHALEDNDPVHAVILGSSLNQDGRTAGISLPNPDAQATLIRQVYENAGIDPANTLYVEAHGTGTQAGDKAEIDSISRIFCGEKRKHDLFVGSIKSNIGHLEAASGVAGLIKAAMILKKGHIPPNIDLITPKPSLNLDKNRIKIPTELVPLKQVENSDPRRVSLNSFGYGGTNCHLILEQAPVNPAAYRRAQLMKPFTTTQPILESLDEGYQSTAATDLPSSVSSLEELENPANTIYHDETKTCSQDNEAVLYSGDSNSDISCPLQPAPLVFPLTAASESALKATSINLKRWIADKEGPAIDLHDLAFTLISRRSQLPWRTTFLASDREELEAKLGAEQTIKKKAASSVKLVFVFTGQGAQWHGMGHELIDSSIAFRRSLLLSDEILKEAGCEWSLIEELNKSEEQSQVGNSKIAQPSTTAIQIALVEMLATFGVQATCVIGHSSGEIAAAYAAGALSHREALEVAYFRGLASSEAKTSNPHGAMLAVGSTEHDIEPLLKSCDSSVRVACVNSPESLTLSGDELAIDKLEEELKLREIFVRKLRVDTAYHSHHMERVADSYSRSIEHVTGQNIHEGMSFYSSVSGEVKTSGFGASYWTNNLTSKVRFSDALQNLAQSMHKSTLTRDTAHMFLEIGPHSALKGPIRQTLSALNGFKHLYLSTLIRGEDAARSALACVSVLFETGFPVNLEAMLDMQDDTHRPRNTLDSLLPYPWDHTTRYWWESRLSRDHRLRHFPHHDLLGIYDPTSNPHAPRWRYSLNIRNLPWLKHHVVDGRTVFPGTGFAAMAIEALKQLIIIRKTPGIITKFSMRNMTAIRPIILYEEIAEGYAPDLEVHLVLTRNDTMQTGPWETFHVFSYNHVDDTWTENCFGSIRAHFTAEEDEVEGTREEDAAQARRVQRLERVRSLPEKESIDPDKFYSALRAAGNDFGPTFSTLKEINIQGCSGHAKLDIADIPKHMPKEFLQPHTIHPATLDAISQAAGIIFKRECSNSPMMLVSVSELTISANIVNHPGAELEMVVELRPAGKRFASGDTLAFQRNPDDGTLSLACEMKDFNVRSIGGALEDASAIPFHRRNNYKITWSEDIDLLTESEFRTLETPMYHGESDTTLCDSNGMEDVSTSCRKLALFIQGLAFKNPTMNFLHIHDDAGCTTKELLRGLEISGTPLFHRYHYGDIDESRLDAAKKTLKEWKGAIKFKLLDFSKDLPIQGQEKIRYDLVLVSAELLKNCTPATKALSQIQRLIRPGGRILIIGQTSTAEDKPSLRSEWNHTLVESKFNDIEFTFEHNDKEGLEIDFIASRVASSSPPVEKIPISILRANTSPLIVSTQNDIHDALLDQGFSSNIDDWESTTPIDRVLHVIVDAANDALLAAPTAAMFEKIKTLLTTSRHVLWISIHEEDSAQAAATKGLVTGLARVMRRENHGMRFITLDVKDDLSENKNSLVQSVLTLLEDGCAFGPRLDGSSDYEYALSGGRLLIPRIHSDSAFNYWNDRLNGRAPPTDCLFRNPTRPLKLEVETPGLLNSLRFVPDVVPLGVLDPDEIQIEASAFGVNFRDVFIALGQMPDGLPMAGEVAGVVTNVGSNAQHMFSVGDRVVGVGGEPFASHPRLKSLCACKIPPEMSLFEAASIPIVFLTAYYALVELARLEPGQRVLIQAASGGVGQAAIQLAQYLGAEVFATVSSVKKRDLIIEQYGLAEDHIFSSRMTSFKDGILRLTDNRGVDVVLNSLAGDMLNHSWESLAPVGMHIEIGKTDIYRRGHLDMKPFDKNITFASIDLLVLFKERSQKMHNIFGKVFDLFTRGHLRVVSPLNSMPIDKIEPAFRLISDRKHIGKVILEANQDSTVNAVPAPPNFVQLQNEGTYLVVGGLGDLGRRICLLLAKRGAGHVIALSRRSLDPDQQAAFEEKIESHGARLHIIRCDVTQLESVEQVSSLCHDRMLPPVRGIVHGGMVLRDHPLSNMDLDDYLTSIGPKVLGTLHLDQVFASPDLDFFITLSSVSAILGKSGQSNYSAGNSFQDSFAHASNLRNKNRTNYVSLNLGAIDGSESITSLPARQQELMRLGAVLSSFDELYRILDYAMDPQDTIDRCTQCIMGFDRESMTAIQDDFALSNSLFNMIPHLQRNTGSAELGAGKVDILQAVRDAESVEEAARFILEIFVGKVALFMGCSPEDISLSAPVASFGMDSLVMIEFRNWVTSTFEISIQTSHMYNEPNIPALALEIAKKCKNGEKSQDRGHELPQKEISSSGEVEPLSTSQSEEIPPAHGYLCCKKASTLPSYPLISLEGAMKQLVANIAHFARNDKELENFHSAVEDFMAPGGQVDDIYGDIQKIANDPSVENWQDGFITNAIHHKSRYPLVFGSSFMATHHEPRTGIKHTQSERAALIATSAFRHKKVVENGRAKTHYWFGVPSCSYQEQWLYNTYRKPGVGLDETLKFEGNYFIALRKGRIFKVDLCDGDGNEMPMEYIKTSIETILAVHDEGLSIGLLTTDERDSWASNFETLAGLTAENAKHLQVIMAAAFVICLDEEEAPTSTDLVRLAMLTANVNRWYDKGLQFVVSAGGSSAYIVEHSMIDGLTVHEMNASIQEAIQGYQNLSGLDGDCHTDSQTLNELVFSVPASVSERVDILRSLYPCHAATRDFLPHTITALGNDFLFENSTPIKGVLDATIQLASRLFYGSRDAQPPAFEHASMAHFHHGRPEIVDILTPAVVEFCEAAATCSGQLNERKKLLLQAASELTKNLRQVNQGGGYYSLIQVIQEMWPEGTPAPKLFNDAIFRRTEDTELMSGMTDGGSKDSAWFPPNPDTFWLCYSLEDKSVNISIVGPKAGLDAFQMCLDKAALYIRELILA